MGNSAIKEANNTKVFTQADLGTRKDHSILLISIFGKVYNAAKYLPHHPGGNTLFHAGGDIIDDVFSEGGTHSSFAFTNAYNKRQLKPEIEKLLGPQVGSLITVTEDEVSQSAPGLKCP